MMKVFLMLALLLFGNIKHLHQKTLKLPAVRVMEEPIIDSVLNKAMLYIEKKDKLPLPCIVIELYKPTVSINPLNRNLGIDIFKTNPNMIEFRGYDYNHNLCYFEYKGYIVFVVGQSDRYHFFSKARDVRTFNFVPNLTNVNLQDKNTKATYIRWASDNIYSEFYQYIDNKLISTHEIME